MIAFVTASTASSNSSSPRRNRRSAPGKAGTHGAGNRRRVQPRFTTERTPYGFRRVVIEA